MTTTVYTQTHLDNLDEAIANGHLSVKYADKEVKYRSLDEMMRIRAHIAKALGLTNSVQAIRTNFSKGFTCADDED